MAGDPVPFGNPELASFVSSGSSTDEDVTHCCCQLSYGDAAFVVNSFSSKYNEARMAFHSCTLTDEAPFVQKEDHAQQRTISNIQTLFTVINMQLHDRCDHMRLAS